MTTKKRKVDSECRVFKEEWSWKYFFTEFKDKPVCLICNETVAVFKYLICFDTSQKKMQMRNIRL